MTEQFKENVKKYKVLTPSGYQEFIGIRCLGEKPVMRVVFENNYHLVCTLDHKIFIDEHCWVLAETLKIGSVVVSNVGVLKVVEIDNSLLPEKVYDLIDVNGGHRYYTNGVLSSNCEPIIYEETLISPLLLAELEGTNPIERQGQVRWYSRPKKNHTYVVGLDPSLGTGGDNAAIQVFELPTFKQVAEWQHNKTPIQQQIRIMRGITAYLFEELGTENDIYYSVENNSIGEAALLAISEIGEENIRGVFMSQPKKPGQSRAFRKGFNTTRSSKSAVCSKFKQLMEQKRLTVVSKPLISELKNYVAIGDSFAGKPGETDDLVSATLIVIRIIQCLQNYDAALDTSMRAIEDEPFDMPLPFIMTH